MNMGHLREDICTAINRNSAENGSDTPDWILTDYLMNCLEAFNSTMHMRSAFYNHHCCVSGCRQPNGKDPVIEGPAPSQAKTVLEDIGGYRDQLFTAPASEAVTENTQFP